MRRVVPTMTHELDAVARGIIDTTAYLVLGTVDADGSPRVSPVHFTPDGYRDFYWVSRPGRHHSRNLERDARVAATVFDSTVPVSATGAVYLTGHAHRVADDELAARLPVAFRPLGGAAPFPVERLSGAAPLRLYVLHAETVEAHDPDTDDRVRIRP